MFTHSGMSIWPVLTPNGTSGSTTTRAPRSHARPAASAAIRGADWAQRLRGFSRHRGLELQRLVLTEFVRDALDAMRRGVAAGIDVQFEVDEDAGVIEADPAAVKQILLHLVTNARDAMSR